MKKLLVIALVVVLALSAVALVACDKGETYTGYCYYSAQWGNNPASYYGCVVDVTVKGDKIVAVKLYTDEKAAEWAEANNVEWNGAHRTTTHWDGFEDAEAAYEGWIEENIVGQTVDAVKGWTASATGAGQTVGEGVPHIESATQSCARIIVAIQNALSKIEAAA